ncbi:MAG: redoxin domain-containing protein [archaeon]|nr:redoxin domain-containing protein [archaeon]
MGLKKSHAFIVLPLLIIAGVFVLAFVSPASGGGNSAISFSDAIGKPAPDFELQDLQGNTIKLADLKGKNVVLFFSEGSMCYPACWVQAAEFGKDERFNNENVMALSIVVDSKAQWQSIMQSVPSMQNAKLLFDTTKNVSTTYDVLNLKSSMHKGSTPGHTYFIVDKEGIIRFALDDPSMAVRNDELNAEIAKLS